MTSAEIIEIVRQIENDMPPSSDISKILCEHKCDYLYKKAYGSSGSPKLFLDTIANRVAVKERLKACQPIFEQKVFPYAVIKGAVLSYTMYNDPCLRSSGDIDILIRKQDLDIAKGYLMENGFIQGRIENDTIVPFSRKEILYQTMVTHQAAPFVKATGNQLVPFVNLDINTDITWGENECKPDMEYVLKFAEPIEILGTVCNKLKPEMEFVALCLHHYKDFNSLYLLYTRGIRLGQYCELYEYLKKIRPDGKKIFEIVERIGMGKHVYVCIAQLMELFQDSFLSEYMIQLGAYEDPELYNSYGLKANERKRWEISLLTRVFYPDLREYLDSFLTESDKKNIQTNMSFM